MNNKVAYVQVLINRLLCEKTNDDKDKIEHKLIFKLNVAVVGNSRERKKNIHKQLVGCKLLSTKLWKFN